MHVSEPILDAAPETPPVTVEPRVSDNGSDPQCPPSFAERLVAIGAVVSRSGSIGTARERIADACQDACECDHVVLLLEGPAHGNPPQEQFVVGSANLSRGRALDIARQAVQNLARSSIPVRSNLRLVSRLLVFRQTGIVQAACF